VHCAHHHHLQVDASLAILSVDKAIGRELKWWRKGLYWVVDQMVTNAAILFNELNGRRRKLGRREFVIAMLEGMQTRQREHAQSVLEHSPPPSAHAPLLRLTKTSCQHPDCWDDLRLCHPHMSWEKRDCFARYHRTPYKFGVQKRKRRQAVSPAERPTRRVRPRRRG